MTSPDRSALRAESVRAVHETMGCVQRIRCGVHEDDGLWTDQGCPRAVAVADAAAAPYVAALAAAEADLAERPFTGRQYYIRESLRKERAEAERDALAARLARLTAVHARYFDTDVEPPNGNPEPEDVWRFDRDFRAALAEADEKRTNRAVPDE